MDIEQKLALLKKYPTTEILTEQDLLRLLESGEQLKHYIGFEISGFVHLGTGLFCAAKLADIQRAGFKTTVFLADWHSWINKKLGENWEAYKIAGKYFAETLKRCAAIFGADPEAVEVVYGSELYHANDEYWKQMIEVAKHTSLARARRSITILGRKMGEKVDLAQLIYVPMQVTDIFALGVHLAHAGIDQRKAHVIAREVAKKLTVMPLKLKEEIIKPVALHHELLYSFAISAVPKTKEEMIEVKMSKSKPESCAFVHDSEEELKRKILNAYCPPRQLEYNPVIQLARLVFRDEELIEIEREERYGGTLHCAGITDLLEKYSKGELHPLDLKRCVAEKVAELLRPVREYFEGPGKSLLEEMRQVIITR
ncbi:MAG: tyrosine--tRNA ligase [bacterium]|nr:tyrosine--tRNA ligase [bacterium]